MTSRMTGESQRQALPRHLSEHGPFKEEALCQNLFQPLSPVGEANGKNLDIRATIPITTARPTEAPV